MYLERCPFFASHVPGPLPPPMSCSLLNFPSLDSATVAKHSGSTWLSKHGFHSQKLLLATKAQGKVVGEDFQMMINCSILFVKPTEHRRRQMITFVKTCTVVTLLQHLQDKVVP